MIHRHRKFRRQKECKATSHKASYRNQAENWCWSVETCCSLSCHTSPLTLRHQLLPQEDMGKLGGHLAFVDRSGCQLYSSQDHAQQSASLKQLPFQPPRHRPVQKSQTMLLVSRNGKSCHISSILCTTADSMKNMLVGQFDAFSRPTSLAIDLLEARP